MREREKIKIARVIGGRTFERDITDLSRISSNEAATMLNITLRHLYNLVRLGDLHPVKKKGQLLFRFKEIERFLTERR